VSSRIVIVLDLCSKEVLLSKRLMDIFLTFEIINTRVIFYKFNLIVSSIFFSTLTFLSILLFFVVFVG
jgi:hypothetical protein